MPLRLFVLFCLLACAGFSQSWHALVKAGVLWNSKSSQPVVNEHSSYISGTGDVGVSRQWRRWETGLALGFHRYAFHIKGSFLLTDVTGKPYIRNLDRMEKIPSVTVSPFVNWYFGTDSSTHRWYAGIAVSYIAYFGTNAYDADYRGSGRESSGAGFGAELHGGYIRRVSENVSVFGEPAIGIINLPVQYGAAAFAVGAALCIGIRLDVLNKEAIHLSPADAPRF